MSQRLPGKGEALRRSMELVRRRARALAPFARRLRWTHVSLVALTLAVAWVVRLEARVTELRAELGRGGPRPSGLERRARRAEADARTALELARAAHHAAVQPELVGESTDGADASERSGRAIDRATIAEELARSAARLVEVAEDRSLGAQRIARTSTAESERAIAVSVGAAAVADLAAELAREAWFSSVPIGTIVAWAPIRGSAGNGRPELPDGWAICDGTAGTPDLTGRFLRGSSIDDAGAFHAASTMSPAGRHAHATESMLNSHQWFEQGLAGLRKGAGEGLVLLDRAHGVPASAHGEHVHDDPNVPVHYTVVFIQRIAELERAEPKEAPGRLIHVRARPEAARHPIEAASQAGSNADSGVARPDSASPTEPRPAESPLEASGG